MQVETSFFKFIENKTLFYDKIDYEVIYKSWRILSQYIKLPYIIHLVGTNGKGTTGRFIASFLNQKNKNVLHYSSPHIEKFNERIWINGDNISANKLQKIHEFFIDIFPIEILEQLTYFEYTTLMALYASDGFDYIVLEAGLGGEFDATNVVSNNLTIVPSIGMDHMDFLGDTITKIATTKLRSCDSSYIFGLNMPDEVIELKNSVLKGKKEVLLNNNLSLNLNTKLPKYLSNNLSLALSVMEYLDLFSDDLDIDLIEGRFEKYSDNITLDVGHNPLAAQMIAKELGDTKVNLVYNSYKDKDYAQVLEILQSNINMLYIIECDDERIEKVDILQKVCNEGGIKSQIFDKNIIVDSEKYLVFGSFKVIETFKNIMKSENEKQINNNGIGS
jgi:dihydrofolate synthase/folylpolyglutamate synthase